jgi:hypothetical protein
LAVLRLMTSSNFVGCSTGHRREMAVGGEGRDSGALIEGDRVCDDEHRLQTFPGDRRERAVQIQRIAHHELMDLNAEGPGCGSDLSQKRPPNARWPGSKEGRGD